METDPSWLVMLMLPGVVGSRKPSCVHLEKISLEDTTAAGEMIVSTVFAQ